MGHGNKIHRRLRWDFVAVVRILAPATARLIRQRQLLRNVSTEGHQGMSRLIGSVGPVITTQPDDQPALGIRQVLWRRTRRRWFPRSRSPIGIAFQERWGLARSHARLRLPLLITAHDERVMEPPELRWVNRGIVPPLPMRRIAAHVRGEIPFAHELVDHVVRKHCADHNGVWLVHRCVDKGCIQAPALAHTQEVLLPEECPVLGTLRVPQRRTVVGPLLIIIFVPPRGTRESVAALTAIHAFPVVSHGGNWRVPQTALRNPDRRGIVLRRTLEDIVHANEPFQEVVTGPVLPPDLQEPFVRAKRLGVQGEGSGVLEERLGNKRGRQHPRLRDVDDLPVFPEIVPHPDPPLGIRRSIRQHVHGVIIGTLDVIPMYLTATPQTWPPGKEPRYELEALPFPAKQGRGIAVVHPLRPGDRRLARISTCGLPPVALTTQSVGVQQVRPLEHCPRAKLRNIAHCAVD